jgi:hypothetical protein
MADFSKQYCELVFPEMEPDFDILEISETLKNGEATPIICEGFGFIAIGKNEDGEVILAFRNEESIFSNSIIWKKLTDFTQNFK